MTSEKHENSIPSLPKLIEICDDIDSFGICMKFDQMNKDTNTTMDNEMILSKKQYYFLANMFTYLAMKSQLNVLNLTGKAYFILGLFFN
jgi:hypothetical protein